jgi:hypothetical protein
MLFFSHFFQVLAEGYICGSLIYSSYTHIDILLYGVILHKSTNMLERIFYEVDKSEIPL